MVQTLYYKFLDSFLFLGFLLVPLDRNLIKSLHAHAINVNAASSAYARDLIKTNLEQENTQEEIKRVWRTLTNRQRQVALLISQNFTYAQMGKQLYLSPHTVRVHARALMDVYGVHSKRHLNRKLSHLPDHFYTIVQDIDSLA
jgi:DNA-binding NarL/FixJ family response regulator